MARLWTFDDFLQHEFSDPPYLVKPMIPTRGIFLLHGKATSGKSLWAITLAKAVAEGAWFLRRFPTRQGSVLVIETDMGDSYFQDRLKKTGGALANLPVRLLTTDAKSINVKNFGQFQAEAWKEARASKPSLVIVDTLSKTHRLPENEDSTPSEVYPAWQQLFPDSTLVFLHHDNKDAQFDSRTPQDRARGSSKWIDDSAGAMRLRRTIHDGQVRFRMTHSKPRGPYIEELVLEADPDTLLLKVAKPDDKQLLREFILRQDAVPSATECATFLEGVHSGNGAGPSRATRFRVAAEILAEFDEK